MQAGGAPFSCAFRPSASFVTSEHTFPRSLWTFVDLNGEPAAISHRMDREQRSEAKGPFSLAPLQSQSGFSHEVEEVSEIVDGEAAFIRSGCR
jgi:hypothetical protein